jgi:hypothetical protein
MSDKNLSALPVIVRLEDRWHISWDCEAEYLELELLDTGLMEWFWRSRLNNETDGNEDAEPLCPPAFATRAAWFQQALIAALTARARVAPWRNDGVGIAFFDSDLGTSGDALARHSASAKR